MTASEPIACTLGAADYATRLAWIAELNRTSLQSHAREGRRFELRYAPRAAAQVAELVQREQSCCAFLHFEVTESADTIRVRVTVPVAASESAADLLAPFLTGAAG